MHDLSDNQVAFIKLLFVVTLGTSSQYGILLSTLMEYLPLSTMILKRCFFDINYFRKLVGYMFVEIYSLKEKSDFKFSLMLLIDV